MKQITPSRGGACRTPSQLEAETAEILLTLPDLIAKKEFFSKFTFTWGKKKKRSVFVNKSELSPVTHISPEKLTAADKSPSTPLYFLPCGSGSDGYDNPNKEMLALKKSFKRKATDDLIVEYNEKHQEKEMLIRKIQDMNNHLQELQSQNLELIAKRKQINYPRNMENVQLWTNPININQYNHQQITIFTPPQQQQPRQQQRQQQLVVDPNSGKLVAMSCSSNSNGGGRFGLFNHIETRVNIHGETYDFMSLSQPLDQNNYMLMDKVLKVRNAAAARKRRIMRMKENKYSMKQSRLCR